MSSNNTLLEVRDLRTYFDTEDGTVKAVDGISFQLKRGATLGANSTIVCGVTIGEYAFVGAGAVVTKDVPEGVVVAGNPAHVICTLDEYERKCAEGHLDVPKDRRALRRTLEEHFWGKSA